MTVGQLLQNMSGNELVEWIAYDRLDPIGGYRQDINTAWLAYLANGEKDKAIEDFLIIDPNPVSAERKKELELAKEKQKLRRQVASLAIGFDNVKVK